MKLFNVEKKKDQFIIYIFGFKIKHKKKRGNPLLNCCYIPEVKDLLNKGTIFPHPYGIVISELAKIGNECIIYQNVTIGTDKSEHGGIEEFYPTIDSRVTIYANSVIAGNVRIGNNAIIGANSVVLEDIPQNAVAVGSPAKVVKYIEEK